MNPAEIAAELDPTELDTAEPDAAQLDMAEPDIDQLRVEIDDLDDRIVRLVQRRSQVSRLIGAARMAAGGTKIVHSREMAVLNRYRELGPEGRELAMLLLRLGRGRLGR